MFSLKTRSYQKEIMDGEPRSTEELVHTYRLIRRVNRFLGGTRVTLAHLKNFSRRWASNDCIRILDVATGVADIPEAIVKWARKRGRRVKIVALDINPQILAYAGKKLAAYPEITLMQASVFDLPFPPASFDYVITSQFFHHLNEPEAIQALKILSSLARRGIIVNDLVRRLRAYGWIYFFSRFSKNEMFRNDATLSVRRGYRRREIEEMIKKAGLNYLRYFDHPFHRFAIAGEKTKSPVTKSQDHK